MLCRWRTSNCCSRLYSAYHERQVGAPGLSSQYLADALDLGWCAAPRRYSPSVSEYQTIEFEQSGAVARITLNRPDAANGMNDTMTRELADAAARCDTEATKVVLLTGRGPVLLCRGRLKAFAAAPSRGRVHQRGGRRSAPRDLDVRTDGRRGRHRRQRRGGWRRVLARGRPATWCWPPSRRRSPWHTPRRA